MRKISLLGLLAAVLIIAAGATLRAPSLAGKWTANFSGHPLALQLQAAGSAYKGTYSITTVTKLKNGTLHSVVSTTPVTATVKVVKKQMAVALTFTATKITASCVVVKSKLECVSPAEQKLIVFTHVQS